MTVNCTDLCTYLRKVSALIKLLVFIFTQLPIMPISATFWKHAFWTTFCGAEVRVYPLMCKAQGGFSAKQRMFNFAGVGALCSY